MINASRMSYSVWQIYSREVVTETQNSIKQVMKLELILNRLKNYSRRKPLDFEVQNNCFVDKTVIEDLADGTVQK